MQGSTGKQCHSVGAVWAGPFIIGIKPYTIVGGSGDRKVQKVELEIRGVILLRND